MFSPLMVSGLGGFSEKAGTVDFEKHPARKVGTRSRPVWTPETLEFIAFRDSGKIFQHFSRNSP